jgi:RHS repeat-associated protein
LTKAPGTTNTYDAASQLETGTGAAYSYDKLGERIKTTPEAGPSTTYKYDQAARLTSVEKPEEGEVPAVGESFAYDGRGLVASKTSSSTTHYLTWDCSAALPLLLDDGQNSYIYGPGALPIEQISGEEAGYLHHDQLGSTRLLTDAGGEATGMFSYGAYGQLEAQSGSATTPIGYAGQYTDSASGLQYMRARFYDPATGQFLSRDPIFPLTRTPYLYAYGNPLTFVDPNGLGPCILGFIACDESDDPCDPLISGPMAALCQVVPDSATQTVVNASAGFGDGATHGLTSMVRDALDESGNVDTCSSLYMFSSAFGETYRDFTLTVYTTLALRYYPIEVKPQVPRDLPERWQGPPRDLDPPW